MISRIYSTVDFFFIVPANTIMEHVINLLQNHKYEKSKPTHTEMKKADFREIPRACVTACLLPSRVVLPPRAKHQLESGAVS